MRAKVNSVGLKLHDTPNGNVIDELSLGDTLVVGETQNTATTQWRRVLRVDRTGGKGWVASRFLTLMPAAQIPAAPEPAPAPKPKPKAESDRAFWIACAVIAAIVIVLFWI